jgi:hypothetical protein
MEKPTVSPANVQSQADQDLLKQFFASAQATIPPAADKPTPKSERKAKRTINDLYQRLWESLAYIGSVFIAGGMWYIGASFTLQFLAGLGIQTAGLGFAAWLIPAVITAVELTLWPRLDKGWQRSLVFLTILAFDVGSTFAGIMGVGAGQTYNLFTGIKLPQSGIALWIIAGGAGLIFAFLPEKIGRWAVKELHGLWR